jgi:hypothetical protein
MLAEEVGLAVTIQTRIQKVLGSVLGWDTVYPEALRYFPQSLQTDSWSA